MDGDLTEGLLRKSSDESSGKRRESPPPLAPSSRDTKNPTDSSYSSTSGASTNLAPVCDEFKNHQEVVASSAASEDKQGGGGIRCSLGGGGCGICCSLEDGGGGICCSPGGGKGLLFRRGEDGRWLERRGHFDQGRAPDPHPSAGSGGSDPPRRARVRLLEDGPCSRRPFGRSDRRAAGLRRRTRCDNSGQARAGVCGAGQCCIKQHGGWCCCQAAGHRSGGTGGRLAGRRPAGVERLRNGGRWAGTGAAGASSILLH